MKEKITEIITKVNASLLENNDGNWIEDGMIDSFDMIAIISSLQEAFEIEIEPQYILPENFGSIDAITKMVEEIL